MTSLSGDMEVFVETSYNTPTHLWITADTQIVDDIMNERRLDYCCLSWHLLNMGNVSSV